MASSETNHSIKSLIKKPRCTFSECKRKCALFIGNCSYCKSKYCDIHRLPEIHLCSNMQDCKDIHFQRNQDKLLAEKCVAPKVPAA